MTAVEFGARRVFCGVGVAVLERWAWRFFFFFSQVYFPASGQAVVTGVVPSSPRFLPSIFIAHRVQHSHYSSIFHRVSVANSRSRAFRKSICAQEKVPTNLYEYALGGARTHETDLYQARG